MGITGNVQLHSHSAPSLVAGSLRGEILSGKVAGGERLRQDAVEIRFGVSQQVAREAFNQLVNEGFLRSEPRRGVSVAVLTAEEASEITHLRSLIEPQALEWAIPEMESKDLEEAENLLRD